MGGRGGGGGGGGLVRLSSLLLLLLLIKIHNHKYAVLNETFHVFRFVYKVL